MARRDISDIVTACRVRADQEGSTRNSDATILSFIKQSIAYLSSLVAGGDQDHFLNDVTITASGTEHLTLNPDVHQVRGVDWRPDISSDWVTIQSFNFIQRNSRQNSISDYWFSGQAEAKYTFRPWGDHIKIIPQAESTDQFRIWYVPSFSLTLTSSFNFFNDWDEFVIVDVAIKMKEKDEEDVSILQVERVRLENKIKEDAQRRNTEAYHAIDTDPWSGQ